MTATDTDADYVSAPKDYADLFETYYPYVVHLCGKFGINENNTEDVASEIFLRFMERDSLEKFDSSLKFEYRGQMRPARFKSYLSRAVDMYTRGYRDKQRKLATRELQICDLRLNGSGGGTVSDNQTPTWGELYGDQHDDHAEGVHDMIDDEAEAAAVRQILTTVAPRSVHDRCDLVALFDAARAQYLAYGEYDIKILKDKFGVSSTAMHSWMWWLKANLAQIYGRPIPTKRARRTRSTACQDEQ